MESEKRKPGPSNIVIMERRSLSVSGVDQVVGFDDTQVEVQTSAGLLLVRGQNLNIDNFDKIMGELLISGKIDGLVYGSKEQKRGFLGKLLK